MMFMHQVQQQLMFECMQPFVDTPAIEVSFVCEGVQYKYPMRLPIVASCFVEPLELEEAVFMQRWKALEGEVTEHLFCFSVSMR